MDNEDVEFRTGQVSNLTLFAEPSVMEPAVLQYPRPAPATAAAPTSYLPAPDNKRADYNQNKQLTHAARLSKQDRVLHNRCRAVPCDGLMLTPLVVRMDLSSPTEDMATSVSSEEVASAGGRREVSLSSESSSSGGRGRAQEWDR